MYSTKELYAMHIRSLQRQSSLRDAVLYFSGEEMPASLLDTLKLEEAEELAEIDSAMATNPRVVVTSASERLAERIGNLVNRRLESNYIGPIQNDTDLNKVHVLALKCLMNTYPEQGNATLLPQFWSVFSPAVEDPGLVHVQVGPRSLSGLHYTVTLDLENPGSFRAEYDGLFVVGPRCDEALITLGLMMHHDDDSKTRKRLRAVQP